jgi:YbbR domain-containing protein
VLSTITLEQNQIRVTGPESIVRQISRAAVVLDLNGATSTISTNLDIRLYDEDGDEIPLNSHLTANIDRVLVRAEVLPTKEVRIAASLSGQPASGYRVGTDILIDPGTVTIAGRRTVLDETGEIVIPEDMLNVSGLKADLVRTIDVRSLLPDGVSLVDPEHDSSIRVTVVIVRAPSLEESGEKIGDE